MGSPTPDRTQGGDSGLQHQGLLSIFFNENVSYVKSCHDKSYCIALSQPEIHSLHTHGKKFKRCTETVSCKVHCCLRDSNPCKQTWLHLKYIRINETEFVSLATVGCKSAPKEITSGLKSHLKNPQWH